MSIGSAEASLACNRASIRSQEFRIETAGSGAQFSRPATIELVSRSGSNELHGALFETFRNNAAGLRARQRQDGNTSAKLIRNEFGGSAGWTRVNSQTLQRQEQDFLVL